MSKPAPIDGEQPSIHHGAVAILDALGTKGSWLVEDIRREIRIRRDLIRSFDSIDETLRPKLAPGASGTTSQVVPISPVAGPASAEKPPHANQAGGAAPTSTDPVEIGEADIDGLMQELDKISGEIIQRGSPKTKPGSGVPVGVPAPESARGPEPLERINLVTFSDSYILTAWGTANPRQLLPRIGVYLAEIFCRAITNGVLLRGVVSLGEFVQESTVIIGPAVDEAAEWYEQAEWFGVSATPSAGFGLDILAKEGGDCSMFRKWNVPLPDGLGEDTWAVAWPRYFKGSRENLLETFGRRPVGPSHLKKYRNAMRFFDDGRSIHSNESVAATI